MMKRCIKSMVLPLLLVLAVFALAACSASVPIAVEGANTNVSLDLKAGAVSQKEVVIADYINENGAKEVSYKAISAKPSIANVSAIADGKFKITGVSVGTASVKLSAFAGESETADVEISFAVSVEDTTPRASITGLDGGKGYTIAGESSAIIGEAYSFTVTRLYGYSGTPVVSYTIGGTAGAALTPSITGSEFVYTIAGAQVTDDIEIESVTGFDAFLLLAPENTLVTTDAFFLASSWKANGYKSSYNNTGNPAVTGAAEQEDAGVKFDGTNQIIDVNTPSSLVVNGAGGTWPNEDDSAVGPFQLSFNLKATGGFKISLLGNGMGTSNEMNIYLDNGKFYFSRLIGQADPTKKAIYNEIEMSETEFELDKDNRIDIVYTAVKKKIVAAEKTVADLAEGDILNGLIQIQILINGNPIMFPEKANGDASHSYLFDDAGNIYVQRLNGATAARFGANLSFNTQGLTEADNHSIVVSPIAAP